MSQPKVFEFAKEIGMETLTLMDKIKEWDLPIKNHMASLSDEMIDEIKTRLDKAADSEGGTTKKKTKKKAAKKSTSKKAASSDGTKKAKKVTKKASSTKKTVTKKTSKSSDDGVAKKTTKVVAKKATTPAAEEETQTRRLVIRRSGQEEETGSQEQYKSMKAEDLKNIQSANTAVQEEQKAKAPEAENASVAENPEAAAKPSEETSAETAQTETKRPSRKTLITKKNIIGRMDLSRVKTMAAQQQSQESGGYKPRSTGTGTGGANRARGIRTGFVAPEPMVPTNNEGYDDNRKKDDRKRRGGAPASGTGTGPEGAPSPRGLEQPIAFKSSDFRKREAVFQPKKKKSPSEAGKKTEITTPAAHKRVVKVYSTMSVSQLASELGVKVAQLTKILMAQGIMATPNTELDFDTIALIVPEFNWEAQNVQETTDSILSDVVFGEVEAEPISRPPVVTVMGHVDHGKTTLLDTIRNANVVKGEAGGITQHIGAYRVTLEGNKLMTFIDTPGHEAFTSMRARGANVTDIAIIVVAADDGMMPQTQEAVNHAKAAGVPIIVAVNKMDKPGANPDKIKQQLAELDLLPEDWGGTTIYNHISALKGDGVPELLENIHLVAEMLELKANPKQSGTGIVIESSVQKGRGTVATILVQNGTVKSGDFICAGMVVGKVRQMMNDQGKVVKEAGPGVPVEITGLPETPLAGDRFDICKDEQVAQKLANLRKEELEKSSVVTKTEAKNMSLDALFTKVKLGEVKELPIVLKTDVAGSIEAIKGLLDKIESEEVKIKIIHSAVGGISESDVLLAGTAGGIILGFNVRPDSSASNMAKQKGVEIKTYQIIYEMVDEVKLAMSGMLSPDIVEKENGRVEVRDVFTIPKIGTIAGAFVLDGKVNRNDQVRLVRNGKVIYTGKISSLKRFKDDAKEVAAGFECGIGIENFNDIKVGDIIEAFTLEEKARAL